MGGNEFRFKRFSVRQEGAAMKVGTDGVLLGAWCDISRRPRSALDIGTGTGLLAMILAQRCEEWACRVDAVDIDAGSCRQAHENFAACPWGHNLTVHNSSIQDFVRHTRRRYDLVISNPPYFEDSLHCPDGPRTAARHTTLLTRRELAECVDACLAPEGLFGLVIPHPQTAASCAVAEEYGLYLCEWTEVSPVAGAAPHRSLLMFGRQKPHAAVTPRRLSIEQGGRHIYSTEYMELTRDFYLKF